MSRYIDAEFEENHYASMLLNPTPDVTQNDKKKAQIVLEALRMAKGIDIEPKRGEWIMHIDDLFPCDSTQECSVCHAEQIINGNDDNFCPNCGADMRGKNNG